MGRSKSSSTTRIASKRPHPVRHCTSLATESGPATPQSMTVRDFLLVAKRYTKLHWISVIMTWSFSHTHLLLLLLQAIIRYVDLYSIAWAWRSMVTSYVIQYPSSSGPCMLDGFPRVQSPQVSCYSRKYDSRINWCASQAMTPEQDAKGEGMFVYVAQGADMRQYKQSVPFESNTAIYESNYTHSHGNGTEMVRTSITVLLELKHSPIVRRGFLTSNLWTQTWIKYSWISTTFVHLKPIPWVCIIPPAKYKYIWL